MLDSLVTIESLSKYISAPLIALLNKKAFGWFEPVEVTFRELKHVVMQPKVLKLPDFYKHFIVECDASNTGLGAVLMQKGWPIAYLNKAFKVRSLLLSTYVELLALVTIIQK